VLAGPLVRAPVDRAGQEVVARLELVDAAARAGLVAVVPGARHAVVAALGRARDARPGRRVADRRGAEVWVVSVAGRSGVDALSAVFFGTRADLAQVGQAVLAHGRRARAEDVEALARGGVDDVVGAVEVVLAREAPAVAARAVTVAPVDGLCDAVVARLGHLVAPAELVGAPADHARVARRAHL
jgi:hypothetical protein